MSPPDEGGPYDGARQDSEDHVRTLEVELATGKPLDLVLVVAVGRAFYLVEGHRDRLNRRAAVRIHEQGDPQLDVSLSAEAAMRRVRANCVGSESAA
jgi:hypothetical protein